MPKDVAEILRPIIQDQVVTPLVIEMDWLKNKSNVLTLCIFLWWGISPFILIRTASSTEVIIGLWVGVGSWIGTYVNYKYPGESTFISSFRTMFLLGSIMGVVAVIYGLIT